MMKLADGSLLEALVMVWTLLGAVCFAIAVTSSIVVAIIHLLWLR